MELGIGAIGVLLQFGMLHVSRLYLDNVGHEMSNVLLRGFVCAACLPPPTMLMGATLPAIARWMESTRHGVSQLGFFYGFSIAGAVFGCALAAAANGQDAGQLVGGMCAANTVGASLGALGFSLIEVAWLGAQQVQQLIMVLAAVSALVMFGPRALESWRAGVAASPRERGQQERKPQRIIVLTPVLTAVAASLLAFIVPPPPKAFVARTLVDAVADCGLETQFREPE